MSNLTRSQAAGVLSRLGWRVDTSARLTQAVKDFQRGWFLGPALAVDGLVGPATSAALLISDKRRAAGQGTMAAHFSATEVRCKCGGRYADCRRIWTVRSVFAALEASRSRVGGPITVTSGCRCPNYNQSIGGATRSQHMEGRAIDWTGPDKDTVKAWRLWNGVGYGGRTDKAKHTDKRTTRSVSDPATWVYATW